MDCEWSKRTLDFLKMTLAKDYTSVSYALRVDGELVAADALGWQDQPQQIKADERCTYNVASVSKIYCTAAVMVLVQRGLIDLDTPVVEYVPEFTMLDEDYKKITVRHLLNHASGLPGTQWKGFSVTALTKRDYDEEVLNYLANSHLKAKPGEYSVYCNDGFTLAEIVVARVSGKRYSDFLRENITGPIQADSTRTIEDRNPDFPLVHEKAKPAELLLVEGAGGLTTSMIDLCKFGQLFLSENPILSEASKQEMAKPQGVSFLAQDQKSPSYGLGWDTVCFSDPDFDLGEGVLRKGGNSFQFTSQLIIIPKYNAVLAISETHDCKIDVTQAALHILAQWLLQHKGISIYKRAQPIPPAVVEARSGIYLMPSAIATVAMQGAIAHFQDTPLKGQPYPWESYLRYDDQRWIANEKVSYFFAEAQGDEYLMSEMNGVCYPVAMKAKAFAPLSETWKQRLNHRYVVVNPTPEDLVIGEIMTGFSLEALPDFEGILVASFSGRQGSDVYSGGFDGSFIPAGENRGRGFLRTPCNGSRDLIDPYFFTQGEAELCEVASYRYQRTDTLPAFQGQAFADQPQTFRLDQPFDGTLSVPEGRRIMLLDKDLNVVGDTLTDEQLKPAESGYLLLI